MKKIESFQVDHTRLKRGIFVSRKDSFKNCSLTTFDLRMKEPDTEPVLDNPALHTIEHLGATFLRSHLQWAERVVYFGPMGCRTGFYVILEGELESRDILALIRELFEWILDFNGPVPGASAKECGNWQDQNLTMAKYEAAKYLDVLKRPLKENLEYPS